MVIQGFGSVPHATTKFPNGSTPACSYYLGFYATLTSDWGDYAGEWYFTEQTISHNGGDSGSTSYLDLFPSQISLYDLFKVDFDPSINIYSIRLTLELQRESGEGFLGFDKTVYYDITLEAAEKYSIDAFPITYFIDKNGDIVKQHRGMISDELLREYLSMISEEAE